MLSTKKLVYLVCSTLCLVSFAFADDAANSTPAASETPVHAKPKAQSSKKKAASSYVVKESIKKGISIDNMSGPRLAAAMGHYSRAKALLITAVREFDEGVKITNPDLLLNSDAWRKAVIDQASDLDKVLAPQARAPEGGVQYDGDARLLHEPRP